MPKQSNYLQKRAHIFALIREFFREREVMEVDTPLLYPYTIPDPHIHSFEVNGEYLQTSPEFAMKQLLADGSGSIYQLCKAFRLEESGRYHHREFFMLEWYRVGFTHRELMKEMDALLQCILGNVPAKERTYGEVFQTLLNINPHTCSMDTLVGLAKQYDCYVELDNKDDYLHLLMSHVIEPAIGQAEPVILYDFPASQAALARLSTNSEGIPVAERFEVYFKGIELANGFHELNSSHEQRKRFMAQQTRRREQGQAVPALDEAFLHALDRLPDCAGVALGIDRLIMLACHASCLGETTAFITT